MLSAQRPAWQRDFYEHRLRVGEDIEAYAFYIFLNPYRAELISMGAWPAWWSAQSNLLEFTAKVNSDGSPPKEWLNLTSEGLHIGTQL